MVENEHAVFKDGICRTMRKRIRPPYEEVKTKQAVGMTRDNLGLLGDLEAFRGVLVERSIA